MEKSHFPEGNGKSGMNIFDREVGNALFARWVSGNPGIRVWTPPIPPLIQDI